MVNTLLPPAPDLWKKFLDRLPREGHPQQIEGSPAAFNFAKRTQRRSPSLGAGVNTERTHRRPVPLGASVGVSNEPKTSGFFNGLTLQRARKCTFGRLAGCRFRSGVNSEPHGIEHPAEGGEAGEQTLGVGREIAVRVVDAAEDAFGLALPLKVDPSAPF